MKAYQNYEKELPKDYKQKLYLNAKNVKLGLVFNLIAMLVFIGVAAISMSLVTWENRADALSLDELLGLLLKISLFFIAFALLIMVYMVLHELVHGFVYKKMTGEKLTFGISWSCAFCGVPNVYVYRKTSLFSSAAPLVIFTVILMPLTAILYFVNTTAYLLSALVFGMHLGGCAGDIYVILLLLFKYKNPKTLVRDTGPEQFFFVPETISEQDVSNT